MNKENWLDNIFLKSWRPYAWIIGLGFLVYFQTLFFGFTYLDDNTSIIENHRFFGNIFSVFQAFNINVSLPGTDVFYRPITAISYILDAQWGGISPFAYHFSNVILHLSVSCLLFLFFCKMKIGRALAFFLSLVFAAHPATVDAVAWIPGRVDVILGAFTLASFIFFIDYVNSHKLYSYFLHVTFLGLSFLSKETSLVTVVMCIVYLIAFERKGVGLPEIARLFFAWLAIIVSWFTLRTMSLKAAMAWDAHEMAKAVYYKLPAALQIAGKVFLPFDLSVLPTMQDSKYIYGIVAIFLLVFALLISKSKRAKVVVFGFAWFILFLLPSFIPTASVVPYFLENRIYLPMMGFLIVITEVDWMKRIESKKSKAFFACLIILGILSFITYKYGNCFKDRISFWESAAKSSPRLPLAHRNLGAMYYLDGELDKAEPEYKKALELNTLEPMAHNNLGLIYMNKGRLKEAEDEFRAELEINPLYDNAFFNLGLLCYRQGRFKEAEGLWTKTIEVNPEYVDAYRSLAAYYFERKNFAKASYYLEQLKRMGASH